MSDEDGKKFAFAYYREDLKAMDCNPDIFAQQNENKDNPHKTKHVDECMKALGKVVVVIILMKVIQV
jgi:predicted TIM-barrel fold metal-dependent hydrolase